MTEHQPPDIFLWANQTDGIKRELDVEFFLFNKNYNPYSIGFGNSVNASIKPLFLYDLLNTVNLGAGTGLAVRDYSSFDGSENTLLTVPLADVGRADTLVYLLERERHDIVPFSEDEHEFKRIKGIVARFVDVDGNVFYSIKEIKQGNVLKNKTAWEVRNGQLEAMDPEVAFQVPTDNQVLIVEGQVFAFNAAKFERLFNHSQRVFAVIDQKIAEIEKLYKLSFPDGLDLTTLVHERKKAISKLQEMVIGAVSHDQAVEYADEIGLELMTDAAGSIIIMDGTDLDVFLNLINEDYATNDITGRRYEIKKKKAMDDNE